MQQAFSTFESGFINGLKSMQKEEQKFQKQMLDNKEKLKETTPYPVKLVAFVAVYCLFAGLFYNYINAAKMSEARMSTDWVFYFLCWVTFTVLTYTVKGIAPKFKNSLDKLEPEVSSVVNKSIKLSIGLMIWNYFGFTELRWLTWMLMFYFHFTFVRYLFYLRSLTA
jgi:hypothetical protein